MQKWTRKFSHKKNTMVKKIFVSRKLVTGRNFGHVSPNCFIISYKVVESENE